MACPTCEHTMQTLLQPLCWCPRCGTITINQLTTGVPILVERCRIFQSQLGPSFRGFWDRLGISESINLPGKRVVEQELS